MDECITTRCCINCDKLKEERDALIKINECNEKLLEVNKRHLSFLEKTITLNFIVIFVLAVILWFGVN